MKTDKSFLFDKAIPINLALVTLSPLIEGLLSAYQVGLSDSIFPPLLISLLLLLTINRKPKLPEKSSIYLIANAALLFTVIASSIYTRSSEYYIEKLIKTLNILYPLAILPFLRNEDIKKTLDYGLKISIALAAAYMPAYKSYLSGILAFSDNNPFTSIYLNFGLFAGVFAIYSMTLAIHENKAPHLLLSIILILFIFISGARGPLVLTIATCIITFAISRPNKSTIFLPTILTAAIIIPLSFFALSYFDDSGMIDRSLDRLSLLFSDYKGASVNARSDLINLGLEKIGSNIIFGHGYGSFGAVTQQVDGRIYPHNLFLEVAFEMGIPGLTALAAIFFSVFINLYNQLINTTQKNWLALYFLTTITYLTLNALKSNTLTDHRLLFLLMPLSLLVGPSKNKEHFSQNEKNP